MRHRMLLATLSGLLYFLSMPPRSQGLLAWGALLPLLLAQAGGSSRQALLLGAWTGFLANLGAYFWIYDTVVNYSAVPAPLGALLACLLAAQQGAALGVWLWLGRRAGPIGLLPVVFVAVEFAYPSVFPMHLSDCQHDSLWTSQCLDLAGPSGLSGLIAGCNVALWQLCSRRRVTPMIMFGLALPMLAASYGALRVPLGRVVGRTRQGEQALLEGEVAWMTPQATPFCHLGGALGWLCLLVTSAGCLRSWMLQFAVKREGEKRS